MTEKIKFILDGCDISFTATAPKDITLEQLLRQCDRIKPNWCACGIRSAWSDPHDFSDVEIDIDYNDVKAVPKYNDFGEQIYPDCKILPKEVTE